MAQYINKDAYVGDTGKQLKDILANSNSISNLLSRVASLENIKIEFGKIAGTSFTPYTNSMSWYQAKYHLTFTKQYTTKPVVLTLWTHDTPTGMGDVDSMPLEITTSGCNIYTSYNISGIAYGWIQYIVIGF